MPQKQVVTFAYKFANNYFHINNISMRRQIYLLFLMSFLNVHYRILGEETMNKLFVLAGASGAGKSTLLDRLAKDGICRVVTKYAQRKKFNTVDDVTPIDDMNDFRLQCDIIYEMYGNKYGFNTEEIGLQLKVGNVALITNDKPTISKLKEIFPNLVIVIYIISDINKRLLRQIYIKRHGFPDIKRIKNSLLEQLDKTHAMILCDKGEEVVRCIEKMNELIDDVVLQEEEFRLRLDSIKRQEELYSLDSFASDYTVLNLYTNNMSSTHATRSAFEQLKSIIIRESRDCL